MNDSITDKTHVLVASGLGRFYITERQAKNIEAVLTQGQGKAVNIDGNVIAAHSIQGIVKGDQIAELDKTKRGDWKCKYNQWHERNQTCAHAEVERYRSGAL